MTDTQVTDIQDTKDKQNSSFSSIFKAALIASLIATVGNLLLHFVGGTLVGGIEVLTPEGDTYRPLPFFFVIIASIVPMLAAGVGLWLFERFLPYGTRIFQGAAVLITLLSLISPLSNQVATLGAGIVLALMHLVEGGVMVWYLTLRNAA